MPRNPTPAQKAASRANGRKSRGPQGEAKQRTRWNSTKTGLRSKILALEYESAQCTERSEVWYDYYQTQSPAAFHLANECAHASLLSDRCHRYRKAEVEKGQVLAELSAPEMDAEVREKRAAVEQTIARRGQTKAAVEVAQANVAGADAKLAETQAGIKRVEADLARWQAEYNRVEQLFQARAQTGSRLDETRNKLRSSEASRDEVRAQVKTAEVALIQSRAALDQARSDVVAAASAIDEKEKTTYVIVVAGKAVRRPIEVGLTDATRAEVVSGLDGSEAVVKAYAATLTDGQPVELVEPAASVAPGVTSPQQFTIWVSIPCPVRRRPASGPGPSGATP